MLVVGDYFTKWIDAIPLPDEEASTGASTFAKALLDRVFSTFGLPEQIHSDQGRNFESKLVHDLCEIFCGAQKSHYRVYAFW